MSMREEMRTHLTGKILPFWKGLKDDEYGGFYGYMGTDLKLDKKAVKGCILNSRILWFFANAYKTLKDESLVPYARHAYKFMTEHCMDSENGGVFWSLKYDGSVEDDTKHIYNQAFAIYALSSYYDAMQDEEALKYAFSLFDIIETKGFDAYGYKEALSRCFLEVSNEKLSENGVMADRTMNTLLHVFEAYTELYRVSHDERVGRKLYWILTMFKEKVYNPQLHRQEVFFDNDMNSLIDLHSFGHDIETSWLLDRGLSVLGDEHLTATFQPLIADLVQSVYEKAYDPVMGSFANECEKGVVNEKRIWWVQAEAVVGFYNQYAKHPEKIEYREAACRIFRYILEKQVDERAGSEWFWYTHKDGTPGLDEPILEPWKCPYHNGRMCMEMMRRLENDDI